VDALVAGNSPWPDPWCLQGGVEDLARAAGWRVRERDDITESVLPNFAGLRNRSLDGLDAVDRGTAVLGRLLAEARLRMRLFAFERG
jgi:hypothetical protein